MKVNPPIRPGQIDALCPRVAIAFEKAGLP
jgi:hypothetical protein